MTSDTTVGKEAIADHVMGGYIDTLGLGTGTTTDSSSDTGLESPVYTTAVADHADSEIRPATENDARLIANVRPGDYIALISVTGGDEIAPGTPITEMGAFIGGSNTADGNPILTQRDVFGVTEVTSGISTTFPMPLRSPQQ